MCTLVGILPQTLHLMTEIRGSSHYLSLFNSAQMWLYIWLIPLLRFLCSRRIIGNIFTLDWCETFRTINCTVFGIVQFSWWLEVWQRIGNLGVTKLGGQYGNQAKIVILWSYQDWAYLGRSLNRDQYCDLCLKKSLYFYHRTLKDYKAFINFDQLSAFKCSCDFNFFIISNNIFDYFYLLPNIATEKSDSSPSRSK